MMKKIAALLLALIMITTLAACGNDKEVEFGWGTYENGTYENEFFDFSIDLPVEYTHLTTQEIIDMNTPADENGVVTPVQASEIDDLSIQALVHFVYAKKYETVTDGRFNPYINIFSENMDYSTDLYNKEDYVENNLTYTALIFKDSGVDVDILPLEKPWIGDRQFAKGTMKIEYDMFTMYQEMYSVTKNNYILVILIGYSTPKEKEELYSYIDTIDIK